MNAYKTLKEKQQKEFYTFPMQFAFTDEQFEEGMRKLGLDPSDTDKIYSYSDTGGFFRKSDAKTLHEMSERHERELKEAIQQDTTGGGFIFEMFNYELANHEYVITGDVEDTLDALGITSEEVDNNPILAKGLKKACKAQLKNYR